MILGKYLKKEIKCRYCGGIIHSFEEKETDVRIATKILSDAYKKAQSETLGDCVKILIFAS